MMSGGRDDYYEGEWHEESSYFRSSTWERDGLGIYIYKNGDFYLGYWKSGKRHYKGVHVTEKNESYYIGDFKDNKRHGYGEFHDKDGNSYIGGWADDK